MKGGGLITAGRQRVDSGAAPAFGQRPGDLEATRGIKLPCCAVAQRDGDTWHVLLLVGLEQKRLTAEQAEALAADLMAMARLARDGWQG